MNAKARASTFIERVVVISIITMLIATLIPTPSRARRAVSLRPLCLLSTASFDLPNQCFADGHVELYDPHRISLKADHYLLNPHFDWICPMNGCLK